ncbi:MAG TPA: hypothetical protein VG013_05070 [Gemmataceae bacterium]|jgi:hypothetical protein|nr:hypothetical protein [Gemmataceae bacterium]
MRFLRLPLLCLALLSWAAPASPADLSKIDRSIKQEPAYQGKPTYCLLVFGPEAKTRAWLVVDGDVLYIDRHADGDLTHPDDRLKVQRVTKDPPNSVSSETRVFLDVVPKGDPKGRDAPTLKGSDRYTRLWVSQPVARKQAVAPNKDQEEYLRRLRRHFTNLCLRLDGKYVQLAWACFSERPQDAPVLHFGGPLAIGFGRDFGMFRPKLVRGPNADDFMVNLQTSGRGEGAVVTMDNRYPPADVHPVADIEFPGREPGGKPTTMRVVLKERC